MERQNRNRTLWIVLGIVLVVCICAAVVVALLVGVFGINSVRRDLGGATYSERVEQTFDAGATPRLVIDNFAGTIAVRPGGDNTIRVTATKKANSQADLGRIDVQMQTTSDGVRIKTSRPVAGLRNESVDLDLQVPVGTILDVTTGAGRVDVRGLGDVTVETGAGDVVLSDMTGPVDAHTGAGSIDVSGGQGKVRLETGAGSVTFRGSPQGDYDLQTGAGSIRLELPADASASLDLTTGIGSIQVEFEVRGQVTRRDVKGTIGSGEAATIRANTGTGSIDVVRH